MILTKDVLKWLAQLLAPYKLKVFFAIAALTIAAGAWLLLGQGIKLTVDEGLTAGNISRLDAAIGWVFLFAVVGCLATYFRFYLMTWLGERISADIRIQVYHHLLTLPPGFFAETRTGEVISRFTNDTSVIQTVVGMSLSMALRSLVGFVGALVLMTITSPMLTLCVLLAVPFILVPLKLIAPKVRLYSRQSQDRIADMGSQIDETLHEIMVVQAFNAVASEQRKFTAKVTSALQAASTRIHYRSMLIGVIMLVSMVSVIAIGWLGIRQVMTGQISAGQLSAFLFYAVLAGSSIATISEVLGDIQRGVGASERLLELLATQANNNSGVKNLPGLTTPPEIVFNQVDFAYSKNHPLFTRFSLTIAAGECVALVGPSGAGKSSLFQLLQYFYPIQAGSISLDEHKITELTLESLRQQIALVPQEPVIFASTVMDNIRYGRPDASEEEVIDAAKQAFADDFINELSEGYHTQLGERGVKLSGGQRQRIAIARAILADRPVLLLDEATSALDAVSEHKVQQALRYLIKGRTTLVIAHRLATVQMCDRIVVLEKGTVRASGTHDELMKSDTLYKEYAELQLIP
ncbi:ABC transporter transmembrane domain-containing protein [Alteromonas lipolytica]|uniref:ABC transporter permease n=1 Tax=Alteromonas lipolytica TaxID=1856405 RepID=A0A1E8FJB4_9ALTE|nr:ABC transporter transmembrane domain-containing protein [Alteromonas lipolytica]OFI36014.1 ABC transporter permease [Alteromonas lipolytica]GGF71674.1 ABC transporter permease [Alteromonas lipolytica]